MEMKLKHKVYPMEWLTAWESKKKLPKSETRTAGNVDRYIAVELNENERILKKNRYSHTHTSTYAIHTYAHAHQQRAKVIII